jgi:hypothetical protein
MLDIKNENLNFKKTKIQRRCIFDAKDLKIATAIQRDI